MTYQRAGTDVLDSRGVRIACCTDETNAMLVLNALLAMEERWVAVSNRQWSQGSLTRLDEALERPLPPLPTIGATIRGLDLAIERVDVIGGKFVHRCATRREADEFACSCGLRWGVDEDDPHGA